jgi:hypothetical protein
MSPAPVIPPTSNEIAAWLGKLIRQLGAKVTEYAQLSDEAAAARSLAEVAFARCFLNAEGAMDTRRQIAMHEAANERFGADVAERKVAACKEAIRALHLKIDVGRTASANVRAELAALGTTAGSTP